MKHLLTLLFSATISVASFSQGYFSKYQNIADSFEVIYGIPSSVMLGVAYHESGAGKSVAAKYLNNHFGIKGSNNLMKTHRIKSSYKGYESVTHSFEAFCLLMTKRSFYTNLKGNTDYKKWVNAISNTNYASGSKTWGPKVISIINKNKVS